MRGDSRYYEQFSTDMDGEEDNISIELVKKDLWKEFHEVTNEMIITKTGRRMFPVVEVDIRGLKPKSVYTLEMEFVPVGDTRFKYQDGRWHPVQIADSGSPFALDTGIYRHPESPNYGHHWMSYNVSFSKVKMCNKPDVKDFIVLNSHYKYCIQIHVLKLKTNPDGKPKESRIHTVRFPLTEFITVTAYQNEEVTALKIRHNPFAKAFQTNTRASNHTRQHITSADQIIRKERSQALESSGSISYDRTSFGGKSPDSLLVTPNGVVGQAPVVTSSAPPHSPEPSSSSYVSASTYAWCNGNSTAKDMFLLFPPLHSTTANDAISASPGNLQEVSNASSVHNMSHHSPYHSGYDLSWSSPGATTPVASCYYTNAPKMSFTNPSIPYGPAMNFNSNSNRAPFTSSNFLFDSGGTSNSLVTRRMDSRLDARYLNLRQLCYDPASSSPSLPYPSSTCSPNYATVYPRTLPYNSVPQDGTFIHPEVHRDPTVEGAVASTSTSSDDIQDGKNEADNTSSWIGLSTNTQMSHIGPAPWTESGSDEHYYFDCEEDSRSHSE